MKGLVVILLFSAVELKPETASAVRRNFDALDEVLRATKFLETYDKTLGELFYLDTLADWNYSTNITEENDLATREISKKLREYEAEAFKTADAFDKTLLEDHPELLRMLKKVGAKSLPEAEAQDLEAAIQAMGSVYGKTKVCLENKPDECYNLEPELGNIMAESTDYEERFNVWKEWRRIVGSGVEPHYRKYVALSNKKAQIRGFEDYGALWRDRYEMEDFESEMLAIYREMEPLYTELHAYIRRRLHQVYGDHIDLQGPLPAHLLSDMWGRFWNNLYSLVEPFPGKPAINPTENLKKQNYTGLKMFQTADNFYHDMGMRRVPESFWNNSMLTKPTDGREVICHATAWDFYNGKDFRIRMCTRDYSFEDFSTIFHEMGHIQYFMQYANQPQIYRDGANNGFHEAIGELMGLFSATPNHLYKLGLLDTLEEDEELEINFLMSQALITITTLPFHLTNDLWSWKVFRGEFNVSDWNDEYWKLKYDIVGTAPPVERREEDVFLDPPTLFHINQDYSMMRYFTRTILQFQFAEKLCEIAGHKGPLHRCDISGSPEAGHKLAEMLRLGSSKPWPEALQALTGERKMTAKSITKFFEPLHEYLKVTNAKNGDKAGWKKVNS